MLRYAKLRYVTVTLRYVTLPLRYRYVKLRYRYVTLPLRYVKLLYVTVTVTLEVRHRASQVVDEMRVVLGSE